MSITAPFNKLYQASEATDPFWRRFEEVGGFKKLSQGYLANRLDMLLAQPIRVAVSQKQEVKRERKRGLVFVDGSFVQELSWFPEAVVLPFSEAYQTYAAFLDTRLQKMAAKEKSALVTLNGAFATDSLFVYIPSDVVIEEPIEIIQYESPQEGFVLSSPRIQMVLGKNSQLTVVREQRSSYQLCSNQAFDLHLEEGARLELVTLMEGSDEGFLFDSVRATLKAHSFLQGHIISRGAKGCVRDYHIELIGENAEATIKAALTLCARRQEQIDIVMEHKAAHCVSDQHIKHVGYAATRHSFSGTIYVHKCAKNTASYQKHSALLLDPTAFVAAQPNLEIFTDEVKASHGATVGPLNRELCFYLMARGLSVEQAEALLIEAHIKEILHSITVKEIRERALAWVC